MLAGFGAVFRREFAGYFTSPLALVFLIVFLVLTGVFTFYVGGFFARGQADLEAFFGYLPWLYLFLAPALAMRLWAEDRRSGAVELLLTLPITTAAAVAAKFCAAWAMAGLALALTFPLWLTVNILGAPDNGVILASYLGAVLMAGGYLAIGACLSAATRNQVIAFVSAAAVAFLFTVSGLDIVLGLLKGWAPQAVINIVEALSVLTHFDAISKGVIDARGLVYFLSLIAVWLAANVVVVEAKREAG
ncbi:MAG: ABC transporter permease [Alphaproteobacteria bacterium]|nr:MAG: ABC transporter permease [Alphaproteobacteria bacterium]